MFDKSFVVVLSIVNVVLPSPELVFVELSVGTGVDELKPYRELSVLFSVTALVVSVVSVPVFFTVPVLVSVLEISPECFTSLVSVKS